MLTAPSAIEYIANLKGAYDHRGQEIESMRSEMEHARHAVNDNQSMQNEIVAMYQQLLRVDPNGHHVFGPKSQSLAEQGGVAANPRLAPLQPSQAPQPQPWMQQQQQAPPQSGAMQGVEYAGRPFDRR